MRKLSICLTIMIAMIVAICATVYFGIYYADKSLDTGLILYGSEEQMIKNEHIANKQATWSQRFVIKRAGDTMIIRHSNILTLQQKNFLKPMANSNNLKNSAITANPLENPILWSEKQANKNLLKNQELPVIYQGNHIIGNKRVFANKILIVADEIFDKMPGDNYTMLAIRYRDNAEGEVRKFSYMGYTLASIHDSKQ